MLHWESGKGLEEGRADTDALSVELKQVAVFGNFVPAYPCGRKVGVAGGVPGAVCESVCGAGPSDADAGFDPFEVDLSLCVFRKIWAVTVREIYGSNLS